MTIREINELIDEGKSLKAIAQAYGEIANIKIKKIKLQVERNRLFFDEISKVYAMVKALASKIGVSFSKPKKRLDLLITSNHRFYGNINSALINFFVESKRETGTDILILGKSGIEFFKATKFFTNYETILLKDDMPQTSELLNLVIKISDYNQVLVFYSKLKSLLVQEPIFKDLTATSLILQGFPKDFNIHFIFEPELPKILSFFDSQILTLLLEQIFLESEVARTASRFISMDQAEAEANKFIKEYQILKNYTLRNLQGVKILENFATLFATQKRQNKGDPNL